MSQSQEFDLPSGARLTISVAPFLDAKHLHDAILKALKGGGIAELDLSKLKDFKAGGAAVNMIAEKALAMASSPEVEAAVFKCGERALYTPAGSSTPMKVSKGMFDDGELGIKAREDYYLIAVRIIEVNFMPFLAPIFSALKAPDAKKVGTLS